MHLFRQKLEQQSSENDTSPLIPKPNKRMSAVRQYKKDIFPTNSSSVSQQLPTLTSNESLRSSNESLRSSNESLSVPSVKFTSKLDNNTVSNKQSKPTNKSEKSSLSVPAVKFTSKANNNNEEKRTSSRGSKIPLLPSPFNRSRKSSDASLKSSDESVSIPAVKFTSQVDNNDENQRTSSRSSKIPSIPSLFNKLPKSSDTSSRSSDESVSIPAVKFTSKVDNTPKNNKPSFLSSFLTSPRTKQIKQINEELQFTKTSEKLTVIEKLIHESELDDIHLRIFLYNYKAYLETEDNTTKQHYSNILQGNPTS